MGHVQRLNERRVWGELSIVLADDEGMRSINRAHRGHNIVTDVISFTYPPAPGDSAYAGEVVVNVEQAVREGPRHGGAQSELALYIAHGCHHLTGATDDTPLRRRRMRKTEQSWLRRAAEQEPFDNLMQETR